MAQVYLNLIDATTGTLLEPKNEVSNSHLV